MTPSRTAVDAPVDVAPEVRAALAEGRAVVALESTIITHGMPFPANLETAQSLEAAVRGSGAVPATIAVMDGRLRAGLDEGSLRRLAEAAQAGRSVAKASRRDLAPLLVAGATAGTTVAATMRIAALAGISVFATGGTGGVHRGATESFDISADLQELAEVPVAVVSAGVKSILDIPKTLEYLETRGVPVIGYRTRAFPAFFARDSGQRLDHAFDSPAEIAAVIEMQRRLGLSCGMLICNPVPEAEALPGAEIEAAIIAACGEAEARGITGQAATPFLLARLVEATGGRTLRANQALVLSNARLAAEIAVALAERRRA